MQVIATIAQVLLTVFLLRALFAVIYTLILSKKMGDQSSEILTRPATDQTSEEEIKEEVIEMFQDSNCGTYISKDNAYITKVNGAVHYFCSWDCREQYLKKQSGSL